MGSESSSGGGAGAGVWKSGNLQVWEFEYLEIWGPENLGNCKSGDLEIQKFRVQTFKKKDLEIQSRSAQNVGKVWIRRKKSSWPHLGPSQAISSMGRKNPKNVPKKCRLSLVGQWALFTRCGPLLPATRGGEIGISVASLSILPKTMKMSLFGAGSIFTIILIGVRSGNLVT